MSIYRDRDGGSLVGLITEFTTLWYNRTGCPIEKIEVGSQAWGTLLKEVQAKAVYPMGVQVDIGSLVTINGVKVTP